MRTHLSAVALLVLAASAVVPTTAQAAPARITDENLKTIDPGTSCVRGAKRPFVNQTTPRLNAFIPAADESDWSQGNVEFRVKNLADGQVIFTGVSPQRPVGNWVESETKPTLANDTTYSWQARFIDEAGEASPWSRGCELSVDTVRPAIPDLSISPGPYKVGQTITLTFGNAGSTDVTKYGYTIMTSEPTKFVSARAGRAKVTLDSAGPTSIRAWSYDRAGTQSHTMDPVVIIVGS
ncbi:hypothetical protein OG474_03010 [Kribbella sp. NBC_01505]|uniref:hypothetical protein n=1 Tax=Kribbella sp. NBC_01505 TaxID=2903580 RepID=UPI003865BCA7